MTEWAGPERIFEDRPGLADVIRISEEIGLYDILDRWFRPPPDPNPFPRFHLFRR